MALVCRAFYEPAMNVLWRELRGLRPLIECLPKDTFEYDAVDNMPVSICALLASLPLIRDYKTMVRDPCPDEWMRFQHHAPHVRKLILLPHGYGDDYTYCCVDYSCFDAVKSSHPGGPILSTLQELFVIDKSAMQYASLFVQPSLKVVEGAYTTWDDGSTLDFLQAIAERCPLLQAINFSDNDDPGTPPMAKALEHVLLSSKHLTSVNVEASISPDALVHLSTLPTLIALRFDLNNVDYRAVLSSTPEPKFPSLLHMDIRPSSQHLEPLVDLLSTMSAKHLRTLQIFLKLYHDEDSFEDDYMLYRPPNAQLLHRLYATLPKFKQLRTLEILPETYESHFTEYIISGDALHPLLQLHELSELHMSRTPFALGPDDVERMAKAWPNLKSLRLGDLGRRSDPEVRPTDLLHFVRHCPQLTCLGLQLLCEDEQTPTDGRAVEGCPESPLRTLHLGEDTIIKDVASLAAFLSDAFPLAQVKHHYFSFEGEPPEWAEQIEEVQRLKEIFVAVRVQERKTSARRYTAVPPSLDVARTDSREEDSE